MNAYILENINKFEIKEIDEPVCGSNDVVVRVRAAGICGSDIPRIYRTGTYHYPLIPGHEFSGEVVKCGDNTNGWKGKRVGVFPLIPCMKCNQCQKEQFEMCSDYSYLGSRTDGGFAEFVVVPEWNLIELPPKVSYEQAAMLEPISVAAHAIRNAGLVGEAIDKNMPIVVVGLGTIGLSIVMLLLVEGFNNISVVGNKKIQEVKSVEIGIQKDNYFNFSEFTEKEQFAEVLFECVGTKEVINAAINSVKPRGKVVCVGNPASDIDISQKTYWQILRKQLILVGTWNSSFSHKKDDDWNYVLDKLENGLITPELLISHKFEFDSLIKGFEIMRDKSEEYIKIMGVL